MHVTFSLTVIDGSFMQQTTLLCIVDDIILTLYNNTSEILQGEKDVRNEYVNKLSFKGYENIFTYQKMK